MASAQWPVASGEALGPLDCYTSGMGLPRRNPLLEASLTAQVDSVAFGKSRYRLRTPIEIRVYQEGELWYHEFEALEISAYGRTREESAEAFSEHFSSIWHWIARVDDRNWVPRLSN